MTLTEDDAAKVLELMLSLLREIEAREVLDGIDESRRLGLEELLPEQIGSERKQVARSRRRPPTNIEMVDIVLGLLAQRLITLPNVARKLRERLNVQDVLWHVDTEFVSIERFPEIRLSDLLPDKIEDVTAGFAEINRLVIPIAGVERKA